MKLFFIFFLAWGANAMAVTNITCWKSSCMKNGWTWEDASSKRTVDYGCYRDGCDISGWTVGTEPKSYTQCKPGGCFKEGWFHVNQDTQILKKQVICRAENGETNCLKYGWTNYGPAGLEAVITCFQKDCATKGWLVQADHYIHANCKPGGCFVTGWTESDY